MDKIKIEKDKAQRRLLSLIMLIAVLVLFCLSFFIDDKDIKFILFTIGTALFIGIFIAKAFKSNFGYKSSIEEIEKIQFGDKNKK